MNYLKENYKNLIFLFLGIIILSFSGIMFVSTPHGADAITVLNNGISIRLEIPFGLGVLISNVLFLVVVLFINRKSIGVGTVATVFGIGPTVLLLTKILPEINIESAFLNYFVSISALVVSAFGLSLYIYSNTGLGSFESIISFISEKIRLSFGITKIFFDAVLFTLGIILGGKGVFGITSILSVLVIGPLVDLFMFLLKKTNIIPQKEKNVDLVEKSCDNNDITE